MWSLEQDYFEIVVKGFAALVREAHGFCFAANVVLAYGVCVLLVARDKEGDASSGRHYFFAGEIGRSNYHGNIIDTRCESVQLPKYPRHWYCRPNLNRARIGWDPITGLLAWCCWDRALGARNRLT